MWCKPHNLLSSLTLSCKKYKPIVDLFLVSLYRSVLKQLLSTSFQLSYCELPTGIDTLLTIVKASHSKSLTGEVSGSLEVVIHSLLGEHVLILYQDKGVSRSSESYYRCWDIPVHLSDLEKLTPPRSSLKIYSNISFSRAWSRSIWWPLISLWLECLRDPEYGKSENISSCWIWCSDESIFSTSTYSK